MQVAAIIQHAADHAEDHCNGAERLAQGHQPVCAVVVAKSAAVTGAWLCL